MGTPAVYARLVEVLHFDIRALAEVNMFWTITKTFVHQTGASPS